MIKKILALATVALMLVISGCDQQPPQNNQPNNETQTQTDTDKKDKKTPEPKNDKQTKPEQPKAQAKTLEIKAYYPDKSGIGLVALNRKIKIYDDGEKYLEAVKILTVKPGEKDVIEIFPKGAEIVGAKLEGNIVVVNFSQGTATHFVGGSTGEELLISSVVKTLTEFPEVKKVKFLIDGKSVETLAGHMDLSEPLGREDF